jgi:hypothetical protein
MSKIERHTDDEDRFHAEILYVLFRHKVRLAELQEMAAQMRCPSGTVFNNERYAVIRESLIALDAVAELPELAIRCAVMPELLEGGDSADAAIFDLRTRLHAYRGGRLHADRTRRVQAEG